MSEFKKCKDCRFFGEEYIIDDYEEHGGDWVEVLRHTGFHACEAIKHIDDNEQEGYEKAAFVVDGSNYFAAIRVRDDFCCAMFEAKND